MILNKVNIAAAFAGVSEYGSQKIGADLSVHCLEALTQQVHCLLLEPRIAVNTGNLSGAHTCGTGPGLMS
jgi:hypothetical protein